MVSQNDIRAIQLAKAALYAGARLLMDRLGVDSVGRVTLAGAFGSHIDPVYAMVLGMIPDCPLDKVGSAGNAAGTGARIALLNRKARAEIEDVVERIEKVETAIEPRFQEHFVAAMAIPHKTAAYPNLAAAVTLPARQGDGRRRRADGGAAPAERSEPARPAPRRPAPLLIAAIACCASTAAIRPRTDQGVSARTGWTTAKRHRDESGGSHRMMRIAARDSARPVRTRILAAPASCRRARGSAAVVEGAGDLHAPGPADDAAITWASRRSRTSITADRTRRRRAPRRAACPRR